MRTPSNSAQSWHEDCKVGTKPLMVSLSNHERFGMDFEKTLKSLISGY